jgi:hypothetical protein
LSRKDKTLKLLVRGKHITSVDRVKPAYIFNEDDNGHTTFKPATTSTPSEITISILTSIAPATDNTII